MCTFFFNGVQKYGKQLIIKKKNPQKNWPTMLWIVNETNWLLFRRACFMAKHVINKLCGIVYLCYNIILELDHSAETPFLILYKALNDTSSEDL